MAYSGVDSRADITLSEVGDADCEGLLLKRADRGLKWNERYFSLHGNKLSYSKLKGEKSKASFVISSESLCEIGDLYIDQRLKGSKKELLYCLKVTWHDGAKTVDLRSMADASEVAESVPLMPLTVESPHPIMRKRHTNTASVSDDDKIINRQESSKSHASTPRRRERSSENLNTEAASVTPKDDTKDDTMSLFDADMIDPTDASQEEKALQLSPRPVLTKSKSWDNKSEKEQMLTLYHQTQRENKKKFRKRVADGGKFAAAAGAAVTIGVLTAGVGLVAGLVFLGGAAAAGGTGVAAGEGYRRTKRKRGVLTIATSSFEEARKWKAALDACLYSEQVQDSKWGQLYLMDGRDARAALFPTEISFQHEVSPGREEKHVNIPKLTRADENLRFVDPAAQWEPMEGGWTTILGAGAQGLRISREVRPPSRRDATYLGCPPLKSQVVLNASPLHAFMCLMALCRLPPQAPLVPISDQRVSFRVLEKLDDHTDIVHLFFRPLYLFPSWTTPRDFVLLRYWRHEADGTYVVCYESVEHKECPPFDDHFVRGEMHAAYTISPRKRSRLGPSGKNDMIDECLMTCVMQVDPLGWVPLLPMFFLSNQGYGEGFAVSALQQLLDIRDAIDRDRFIPTSMDVPEATMHKFRDMPQPMMGSRANSTYYDAVDDGRYYDFAFANAERKVGRTKGFASYPPQYDTEKWAEPDANSFRVRGESYKTDRLKINAGASVGRLIAVDVVRVDAPLYETGMTLHPDERMQLALKREKSLAEKGLKTSLPPFVFVVNVVLPGPPFYHGVFYYAIDDMSTINGTDGTPSSKLCNQFFFGDSDEFRDKTFKLIPQIVEGNFVVRKAVGSTPAIMGTKLRQLYVRRDRFMEVILDCGSSAVATGVIRLSLGYAKTLVIDMGFLFEGDDEPYLPERIFGCARVKYPSFGEHLRKVEPCRPPVPHPGNPKV